MIDLKSMTSKIKKITDRSIDYKNISGEDYVCKLITSTSQEKEKTNSIIHHKNTNLRNFIINFQSENSVVFIGKGVKGNLNIKVKGDESVIFLGENSHLNNVHIRSIQKNDVIAIGNNVTTTSDVTLVSGKASGPFTPYIVIGDDCMLSYNITLRNTDAHPIFTIQGDQQVNLPVSGIHIEPHVWIGQNVTILKSVTIGANSIISLGSIVTKSMPRNSIISGIPASYKIDDNIYWARNYSEKAKKVAKFYVENFTN